MRRLRQIRVAKPCHANWDAMSGDERQRFCGECQKHVHDLTEMTPEEAQQLFENSAGTPCVRFVPDETGAPIFKNTPAWRRLLTAGALGLSAAGLSQTRPQVLGEIASPPPIHLDSSTTDVLPHQVGKRHLTGTPPPLIGKIAVPPKAPTPKKP